MRRQRLKYRTLPLSSHASSSHSSPLPPPMVLRPLAADAAAAADGLPPFPAPRVAKSFVGADALAPPTTTFAPAVAPLPARNVLLGSLLLPPRGPSFIH